MLKKIINFIVLLLGPFITFVTPLRVEQADVGGLCSTDADCRSHLLFCSSDGVCLCSISKANFVYEFRHHFDIREPKCEVRECEINKDTENRLSECELYNAVCQPVNFASNNAIGICKCPGNQIGARRPTYLSQYSARCRDVEISNVGESCSSNSPVCDVKKKLKCGGWMCECIAGHVFSFEDDICIRKEEFVNRFGYSKLGQLGQYCTSYSDCQSGMSCIDKKCDCPYFCSSEVVRTSELCYCPFSFDGIIMLPIVIIIIVVVMLVILVICLKKRQQQRNTEAPPNVIRLDNATGGE